MSYEIEVVRKVFDNENGMHIKVRPDCDGLGLVEIEGGEEYGGCLRVSPQHAVFLAAAIERCAFDMGAEAITCK